MSRIFRFAGCVLLVLGAVVTLSHTPAHGVATIMLRVVPAISEIDLDAGPDSMTLIARVNVEGVEFQWQLEGPGTLEGDLHSRKVTYTLPEYLAETTVATIRVTATTELGDQLSQEASLTLLQSTVQPTPEPTATPLVPTPTPIPEPTATPVVPTPTPLPDIPAELLQRPGKLYAVIIGIGEYADSQIPTRPAALKAAYDLHALLTDPAFGGLPADQIRLLSGVEATERQIKHTIGQWLREQVTAEDTAIIALSGVGMANAADSYWLPYDAEQEELYATALHGDDMVTMLDRVQAGTLLGLFNTCDPTLTDQPSEAAPADFVWPKQPTSGSRVMMSVTGGTSACSAANDRFAAVLLDALRGHADENQDGRIELTETWNYVQAQMADIPAADGTSASLQTFGAPPEDLPLTFDVVQLRKQYEEQRWQAKQERLVEIYRDGQISAEQFKKAYNLLKDKQHDQMLEDFLADKLPLEIFQETF